MAEPAVRVLKSVKPVQPVRMPEPEKPKKKLFWKIYAAAAVILVAVLAVFLVILYRFLAAYEASQPIHAAQELFDRCFASGSFSEAFRLSGFEPGEFEDLDAVDRAVKELGEGKELLFYKINSEEDRARYNVVFAEPAREEPETETGETLSRRETTLKIATMNFRRSEKSTGFGFRGWVFEKLEMNVAGRESVTVTVPRGAALTLNGKPVADSYVISSEDSPYNAFLPEGVAGIIWDKYRVDGLFYPPEARAVDRDGVEMALEAKEEEGGALTARLNYRADLEAELADFVRKGMEAYAAYIQADGPIGTVAKYFDTGSLFYQNTARNPGVWVIDHNGYHFENETVTDFYAYDENTVSCRVDMTQVLTKNRAADYRDHLLMTVFLHKVKGTFRIYDRMTEN